MTEQEQQGTGFDIEEWLADAALPEATVRVSKRGDLVARLADLEGEHQAARRAGDKERAQDVAARIAETREQMEAGWLTIRLRALTHDEIAAVREDDDEDGLVFRQVATQTVEPRLSEDQVRALANAIGEGQFVRVVRAANEVAFGEVVVPDFSPAVLATLATQESSES